MPVLAPRWRAVEWSPERQGEALQTNERARCRYGCRPMLNSRRNNSSKVRLVQEASTDGLRRRPSQRGECHAATSKMGWRRRERRLASGTDRRRCNGFEPQRPQVDRRVKERNR